MIAPKIRCIFRVLILKSALNRLKTKLSISCEAKWKDLSVQGVFNLSANLACIGISSEHIYCVDSTRFSISSRTNCKRIHFMYL